jgi:hypothetical protein
MTKSLEIAGKEMHSIRSVSERTGYSPDYVTRLAREGKIVASQVGRNWYVDVDSIINYVAMMELEQKIRQQKLSGERKRELQLNEMLSLQNQAFSREVNVRQPLRIVAFAAIALIIFGSGAFKYLSLGTTGVQVANVEQVNQISGVTSDSSVARAAEVGGREQLNFSHESSKLSTLNENSRGVLLLPGNTGTSSLDVAELFSDEVAVMTDDVTGEKFVARLNDKGEVLEMIPFVVVPINTKTP